MNRRNVTLKDIARATGVSVNTVSRVLRNKADIAKSTREAVLKAAQEMGHIQNIRASSLRSGVTYTIAVILGDVANPHFAIMMSEIERYAREKGYTTFLLSTGEDEALEMAAIQTALKQSVDGVILCPAQHSTKNVEYLKESGTPFVLIGRYFSDIPTNYVVCNDEQGGYLATKSLLEAGHESILFISGPAYISSARERRAGYLRAYAEAGKTPNPKLMAEVSVTAENTEGVVSRLLEEKTLFTAIFAFSDIIAWRVWNDLQNRGIRIPEDVSLIGFDHIGSRLVLPVPLNSISSYKRRMSTAAVDVLIEAMTAEQSEDEGAEIQVVVNTALAEGGSLRRQG